MTIKVSKTLLAIVIAYFFYTAAYAQTTTVLNFTKNDASPWSGGIVEDGNGGSTDVPGITFQIYNISNLAGTKLATEMKWYNYQNLGTNDNSFSGITGEFDSFPGSKGLAIKSKNNEIFNLNSFRWYDWGFNDGATVTVKGYVNGTETVTTTFTSNLVAGTINNPVNVNFSATPIINVDEVRLTFASNDRYPSINNISLTTNVTLPVSLVNFDVERESDGNILLNWNTSSEQNNKQFIIKHSIDGKIFETIGTLNSKGSTANHYTFKHLNADNGTNYYQLLQEDNNGTLQILTIKSVGPSFNTGISVYPNPTKDYVILKFQPSLFNKAILLNLKGQTLYSVEINPLETNIKFDLQKLVTGTYIIELTGEKARSIKKISKI